MLRSLMAVALFGVATWAPAFERGAVEVLRSLPHDTERYTQGLEWSSDGLLESGGLYGRSAVYLYEPESGRTLARFALPPWVFAEGLTQVDERVVVLSWREGLAWVLDRRLRPLGRWRYRGQGWGLCYDGERFVMSDGSEHLQFRDLNFRLLGSVAVRRDGEPLRRLNELECVDGMVYANVWQTDFIVRIDPADGTVLRQWDLSGVRQRLETTPDWDLDDNVLNGIAHIPGSDRFFVTGKRWPRIFEVRLR